MTLTAEQIAEARSEGYTDAEILDHYAKVSGSDIAAARKEGYSNAEILSHLSGADVAPEPEAPAGPSALSNPALSGALGAGAGAVYSAKTVPVKAAKAFGNAVANRMAQPAPAAPSPNVYTTPSGIPVEQTPGGLHPGAVGNAQFNVEQQQANTLRQNMPAGFEQKGTSRIMTPVGMEEPAAALGGKTPGRGGSILSQKRAEGWPIIREVEQAAKAVTPSIGKAAHRVATSSPVAGAIAGYNLQQAVNAKNAGDTTGKYIGYTGAGSQLIPSALLSKYKALKPVVGAGAALVNKLRGEPESVMNKAEGGCVAPHIEHMRKGGSVQHFNDGHEVKGKGKIGKLWNVGEKIFGNVIDKPIEGNKASRFSEALNPYINQKLGVTQSDNYGIHGNRMGGNQFPLAQRVLPHHAETGAVWMTDSPKHSNDIVKFAHAHDVPTIWTTYTGAPDQLKSNKSVTQEIYDAFLAGARSPEEIDAINNRIASVTKTVKGKKSNIFREPFDIRDKFATQELGMDTFERRGALASLLGTGEGTRKGKLYMGMPEYEDILKANRDELTVGAPTSAVGSRLFTVENKPSEYIHGLHPDYDWAVFGKDQGASFGMVPQELAVPDFYNAYKQRFPKLEPHGNAWLGYNKNPQLITEQYLDNLYKAGYKKGGTVMEHRSKLPKDQYLMGDTTPTIDTLRTARRIAQRVPSALKATGLEMLPKELSGEAIYESPAAQLAMSIPAKFNTPVMANEVLQSALRGDAGDALFNAGMTAAPWLGRAVSGPLGALGAALWPSDLNAGENDSPLREVQDYENYQRGVVPLASREGSMGDFDPTQQAKYNAFKRANMPHMAGGKRVGPVPGPIVGMLEDIAQPFLKQSSKYEVPKKVFEPGAPHTYPPIAEGPWMRDYVPSTGTGLPTTRQGWDELAAQHQAAQNKVDYSMGRTGPTQPQAIQYMGKYRRGTPEERAIIKAQEQDALRSIVEGRKQQWIQRSREMGMTDQEIADEIAHSMTPPWMP